MLFATALVLLLFYVCFTDVLRTPRFRHHVVCAFVAAAPAVLRVFYVCFTEGLCTQWHCPMFMCACVRAAPAIGNVLNDFW